MLRLVAKVYHKFIRIASVAKCGCCKCGDFVSFASAFDKISALL